MHNLHRHFLYSLFWLLLVLGLAACTGQSPDMARPTKEYPEAEISASVTAVPGDVTEKASVPLPTATSPGDSSELHAVVSPTAQEQVLETAAVKLYDGMPQGVTEDGFPYLGDPDAGVTVIDYSDFL